MAAMETTNANPMVIGGTAELTKDLKNSPTRIRISRMVNGSILEMSSMDPVLVSLVSAGEPVRYTPMSAPVSSEKESSTPWMNDLSSGVSLMTLTSAAGL